MLIFQGCGFALVRNRGVKEFKMLKGFIPFLFGQRSRDPKIFNGCSLAFWPKIDGTENANISRLWLCFWLETVGSKNSKFSKDIAFLFD